jgi:hypothetical protein
MSACQRNNRPKKAWKLDSIEGREAASLLDCIGALLHSVPVAFYRLGIIVDRRIQSACTGGVGLEAYSSSCADQPEISVTFSVTVAKSKSQPFGLALV